MLGIIISLELLVLFVLVFAVACTIEQVNRLERQLKYYKKAVKDLIRKS